MLSLASLGRRVSVRKGLVGYLSVVRGRMASNSVPLKDEVEALRTAVKEQGDRVKELKEAGRPKMEIQEAVAQLKVRKKHLEAKEKELAPPEEKFNRPALEDLVKRRFFYSVSFGIYGGYAGLYDYGPMGCAMKNNIVNLWRQHFVLEESLLEIDTPTMTPAPILKTSGHVDRFADVMVKDTKTGECFRADHLIKDFFQAEMAKAKCPAAKKEEYQKILDTLDDLGKDDLGRLMRDYGMKAPLTGNDLSEPLDFNLMFATSIGPGGNIPSFLRPETAQGIFVNFKKLLEFNNGRLPFGGATIGRAFRNEISPRSGLIRVREFELAEIEYFVHPHKKEKFPKFKNVADTAPYLYPRDAQFSGEPPKRMRLGEAVEKGLIANETIAYFVGRIYHFLLRVGIDPEKLRFRQHLFNEMAHYACDCWDAECKTSYGWVECVGCADRACYDLSCHSKATGVDLVAQEPLAEPKTVDVTEAVPDKKLIGRQFKKDSQPILEHLKKMTVCDIEEMEASFKDKGSVTLEMPQGSFTLEPAMVSVNRTQKTVHVDEFQPSVVEPSFGIGRILYAILEHSFRVRPEDEQRTWLALPAEVAPIACSVLPLSNNPEFTPYLEELSRVLTKHGVSHKVDDGSGSIGRRYARTDEIAIPFGITVDFDTLKSNTATLRERNTTKQIRVKVDDLPPLVAQLVRNERSWSQVQEEFPEFTGQESGK